MALGVGMSPTQQKKRVSVYEWKMPMKESTENKMLGDPMHIAFSLKYMYEQWFPNIYG